MKLEKVKIIFWIVAIIAFVIFFINGYYKDKQAIVKWNECSYHGTIIEIKFLEGNRGDPSVLINGNWKTIGINEDKIRNYVQVGDSLVKYRNSELIIVYRKDSMNRWKPRKFE